MRDGGDVLRLHDWSWTDPPFTAERERASPYRGFQAIKGVTSQGARTLQGRPLKIQQRNVNTFT